MSVYIISELCGQWGGSIDKAKKMIDQSAEGGANAVKVQLYDTYRMPGKDRHKWEYLSMSKDVFLELKSYSESSGLDYFASVFHLDRFEWVKESGLSINKIASGLIKNDFELCCHMVKSNIKTYCSLGKWENDGLPFDNINVDYLHCVCKYPHTEEEGISLLPKYFDKNLVGYSDHCDGINACKEAIKRGSTVIEKHFTLDKNLQSETEAAHHCSMNLKELKELSKFCK